MDPARTNQRIRPSFRFAPNCTLAGSKVKGKRRFSLVKRENTYKLSGCGTRYKVSGDERIQEYAIRESKKRGRRWVHGSRINYDYKEASVG